MNEEKPATIPQTEPINQQDTSNDTNNSVSKNLTITRRILLMFSVLLFAFISLYVYLKPTKLPNQKYEYDYLSIVSASPKGESKSTKPRIVVNFNLPVEAYHIAEYFYISPFVKGNLVQGSSPTEVVYEADDAFPLGANVSVTLKSGLPSESGKKLLSDYIFYFNISNSENSITFTKGNLAGKFMSFQQSQGTDITLKVGSEFSEPSVKVYKATLPILLQSFSYVKNTNYGNPTEGEYQEKTLDTKSMTLVKDYKSVKNGDKINFKGDVGLYVFQAYQGESLINTVWVTLNQTGIHLRQDDRKIFLAAQDIESGEPADSIDTSFYELQDKPKLLASHNLSGIQEYPFQYPQRLDLVIGQKGDDFMVIPVSIPNSQAEIRLSRNLDSAYQIFLYTDRPIYRSGAIVSFRGILRKDNDALYKLSNIKKIRVYSGNPNLKFDREVEVSDSGVFYGEFTLPANFKGEFSNIVATTNLDKLSNGYSDYAYANFDVFEYVKPEFGLDIEVDKSEYTKPDIIKARIKGDYFNGTPYANQKVSVSIYNLDYYETEKAVYNSSFRLNSWGGMCGGGSFGDEYYGEAAEKSREIELDKNGEATIEFSTKDLKSPISQQITFLVEKEDMNKNKIVAAKNTVVHQGSFNIFFRPGPDKFLYDQDFSVSFYAEDLQGQKITEKEFSYEVYESDWSNGQDSSVKTILKSGIIKTDLNGSGTINSKIDKKDKGGYLDISIKAIDNTGNEVKAMKRAVFYNPEEENNYKNWYSSTNQTVLKITSMANSLKVGETATLEIVAPEDLKVFLAYERGRSYTPRWLDLKKGKNTFSFEVLTDYAPSITPTFSFFYKGEYFIEGLALNVPALHKMIDVNITMDKEKYKPGDTALITITTKDSNGNLISADTGVGIVDKAIYALRKSATPPLHSSFYFFRGRSLNSSSSLTWIATYDWGGGGGGGGGNELGLKDSDTLYWNPMLKTGSDGEVKIELPLGQAETTWRILSYTSTDDTKVGQGQKDFLVTSK